MKPGIIFYNEYEGFKFSKKTRIKSALANVFIEERFLKEVHLGIIILSDDELLKYNKEFLNHDYYTDIITFTIEDEDDLLEAELYLSLDRIKENAHSIQVDFIQEFYRVLIHGTLHLCGYGDKTTEEEILMRSKEDYYLQKEFKF